MSRTILLADDSVTIQKVIELTFMDENYEVVSLGNGSAALDYLDSGRPDIVIADVHMPGASGYEVCRKVKSSHPDVPVLLLVGTFEPFEEAEAEAAGADSYLKKPFDSQELMGLVKSLLPADEAAADPMGAGALGADSMGADTLGVGAMGVDSMGVDPMGADSMGSGSLGADPMMAGGDTGGFDLDIETGDDDLELDSWDSVEIADEPAAAEEPMAAQPPPVPQPPTSPQAGGGEPFPLGGPSWGSRPGPGAQETAASALALDQGLGDGGMGTDADPFPRLHAPAAADELELDDQGLLSTSEDDRAGASTLLAPPPEGSGRADSPTFDAPSLDSSPFSAPPEEADAEEAAPEMYADESGEEEPAAAPAYEASGDDADSVRDPKDPPVSLTAPAGDDEDAEEGASAPEAPAEDGAATAAAGGTSGLSDDDVERIARRVVELIGEKVVHEIAWEVIPDLAEIVIKDRLQELEGQLETAS